MKSLVIREMTTNEIHERLEDERNQLMKLRLNHAVSPLENPMRIKAYKKIVARLETEIRRRIIEDKSN